MTIIKYTNIEYDGETADLVDSEGNIVDRFYLTEMLEEYLENCKDMKYQQEDDYVAKEEDIMEF